MRSIAKYYGVVSEDHPDWWFEGLLATAIENGRRRERIFSPTFSGNGIAIPDSVHDEVKHAR